MKLLIIGQAPSRAMEPGDLPLWNTSVLTRLAGYAGVSPRERLYDLAAFINLVEDYPGPDPKNDKYDAFPLAAARAGMARVVGLAVQEQPTHVVTLGAAVRGVVASSKTPWFEWQSVELWSSWGRCQVQLACSPHPGGTSMWWNRAENRQAGTLFWRNLFAQLDSSRRSVSSLTVDGGERVDPGL